MRILYGDLTLPVSQRLGDNLSRLLLQRENKEPREAVINFRDPKYSAERGGYHPVEIRLERSGHNWRICYITDFCYVGQGQDVELAKSLDFDFQAGMFQDISGYYPIETALQIYPIWEENFITYWLEMQVFDVEVS
ncbi:DUF2787 domain-containing protein [Rheinheimera sp. D18]|uniref:DUF2787 family protein n=1 Tax=Rheinheimera sp. D18 TaxID=2545632 RepID=UPI001050F206|nr:DUF2787 family protein [Rheinheimera sp. D18]QBL08389.1 DUF2787 domain-containing protein [Rheinheimera sp. D18]